MTFNSIGLDIPLNNKPKRGAKLKRRPCLQLQPDDCVQNVENVIIDSEPDDDENNAKRAKTVRDCLNEIKCPKCNVSMKKKRAFYCPNGCTKKN